MAFIGLPYYGYCTYTTNESGDGSVTEALGQGKITKSVIKVAPSVESNSVELYAGDTLEQSEYDTPTGSVSIERSYISLEEEANICGHTWTKDGEEGGMTHNENDTPPFCRVAAMAKIKKPDRTIAYRVVGYYRAIFAFFADEMNTSQKQKSFGTQTITGTLNVNASGDFCYKNEFTEYSQALADFKKFLNVTEE